MLHFDFTTGGQAFSAIEVTMILNSIGDILMWLFFILIAIIVLLITRYIVKKNAPAPRHSTNTLGKG